MTRWASFDCYGTLIDWEGGIRAALSSLWPDAEAGRLLARFHMVEPEVQAGRSIPYRQVLTETLGVIAEREDLPLADADRPALAESLPTWPPFPEVPASLAELRARGWKLAILSNTDPDLLDASLGLIDVPVDLRITAAEAGSYKPAHGHWKAFFDRTSADRSQHVHVAASLFHDIAPCEDLGIRAVWINRLGETSDLPRSAELPDLSGLPGALDALVAG